MLGLDTSTWRASVGLVEDGRIVAERHDTVRSSHATTLLPLIEGTLADAGASIDAIDAIAVSQGPGSFTGLRISMSIAKGLALATGARLIGVATLEALALSAGVEGLICPMLDARKGEVYWAAFTVEGGKPTRLRDDALAPPLQALSELPAGCTVVGDAGEAYAGLFASLSQKSLKVLPFPEIGPRGGIVAQMGYQQLCLGQPEEDLEPRYIRASEAERNFAG